MATTLLTVTAGSTSAPIAVTPLTNVLVAPAVQGGTVTILVSPTQNGVYTTAYTGTTAASYRPPVNQWVQITAATQNANAFFSDIGTALSANGFIALGANCASPNATTASTLASFRIPANVLPPSFRMEIAGTMNLTNNANVKTLNIYANGITGTALGTSPSLASIANYAFVTSIYGSAGSLLTGAGVLASQTAAQGGSGSSTTALPTLTRDFLTQDTEFVVGVTKATGTDTADLTSLRVTIYS